MKLCRLYCLITYEIGTNKEKFTILTLLTSDLCADLKNYYAYLSKDFYATLLLFISIPHRKITCEVFAEDKNNALVLSLYRQMLVIHC